MASRAKELSDLGNSGYLNVHDDGTVTLEGGNVGIGTSSPVNNSNRATLGLQGAWGGQLDIMVGSTVHAQFGTDNFNTGLSARIQSQDGIVFRVGGSAERMRIHSEGYTELKSSDAYNQLVLTPSGTNAPASINFNTPGTGRAKIKVQNNEYISILSDGKVGIGTTSPSNLLTVDVNSATSTNDSISIRNRGITALAQAVGLRFQYNTAIPSAIRTTVTNLSSGAGRLGLFTSPDATAGNLSERLTILSGGNVGIGTTSPFSKLQAGGHTFDGGNGMYDNSRVGISNHGILTGMMLASTYNDTTWPEYGLVFVQGPTTSNYNVWSISPEGPALGDSLHFIYGSNATNIHTGSKKVTFDGNGNVGIGTTSPGKLLTLSRATEAQSEQLEFRNVGGISNGNFDGIKWSQGSTGGTTLAEQRIHYYTTGVVDMGFNLRFDDNVLYLKAGGNVGIGTASNLSNNLGTLLNVNNGNIIGNGTGGSYFTYNARYDNSWLRNETSAVGIISLTNSGKLTYRTAVSGNAGTEPSLTEIIRTGDVDPAYVTFDGASQVRLTLGNEGTPGTNTANWIRGNAGYLQYNSASSGHTWEIGGSEKMRIHDDGNVGIGITGPIGSLNVNGTSTIYNAHQDQDLTVTPGNGHAMAGSGEICMVATFQGTGANNDLFEFQYDATSWKSFGFEIDISTAVGWGKVTGGGYNNGGVGGSYSISGSKITAFAFDNVAGNNQAHILRCTFGGGVHHTIRVKYWQGGGDGGPRADRATMRFIS